MAGSAVGHETPPHGSLVGRNQVQLGGLRHHRCERPSGEQLCGRAVCGRTGLARHLPQAGHGFGPRKPEFLVDRCRKHDSDAAARLVSEPLQGHEHGCHASLHVAGTPAVEPAIAKHGRKRRDRHAVDRHGVLMGVPEDRRAARLGRVEHREHVVAARRYVLPGAGEPSGGEPLHEILTNAAFEILRARERAAHRIDAGPPDKVGQGGNVIDHQGSSCGLQASSFSGR